MPFHVRNTFYLRISAGDVIPLYVYLDERHVDWMSERTLKSVVSDLRPLSERIGPKLEAERYAHYGPGGPATAKRGTVEVHRSDAYQFAYFLRKAEPHAIVLKTRNYTLINKPPQPDSELSGRSHGKRKHSGGTGEVQADNPARGTKRPRKRVSALNRGKSPNKKEKGKSRATDVIDDSEEEAEESPLSDFDDDSETDGLERIAPRRSTRNKKPTTAHGDNFDYDDGSDNSVLDEDEEMHAADDQDVRVKQEVVDPEVALRIGDDRTIEEEPDREPELPPDFDMDDEEEKKSKPELQLSFRGLKMRDRCLCVVVEPWPALPARTTPFPENAATSRAASLAPSVQRTVPSRAPSIVTSRFASGPQAVNERGQTPLPLFLPDPSGRDRSATPASMRFPSVFSSLETMNDAQNSVEDDDDFGMLAFSQVLNNVSGDRVGAAEEDDDEMDGGALYGDADEMRGVIQ